VDKSLKVIHRLSTGYTGQPENDPFWAKPVDNSKVIHRLSTGYFAKKKRQKGLKSKKGH